MTLNGIDVSRYNAASQIASWLPRVDFGLVCASQGTWLVGPAHDTQVAQLRAAGKRVGHYHYAEVKDGGTAAANYFLAHAYARPGDVLALDYEPFSQDDSHGAQYVVDFANTVRARTGAWPWLYSEDYHLARLTGSATAAQLAVIRSLPLWKAGYSNAYFHQSSAPAFSGSIYGWPAITGWQWSDQPLDRDVFYGSAATWDLLAIPRPHTATQAPTPSTPAAAPVVALTQGDNVSHVEIPGGPAWREIPIPNDGRKYALDLVFGGGAQTAPVDFLTFARQTDVTKPASAVRSGTWSAWQRDVTGHIWAQSNEASVSLRFRGTADQTLTVAIYPIS